MKDIDKEKIIAQYLVDEFSPDAGGPKSVRNVAARTTPYPEAAKNLLNLVRELDRTVGGRKWK